MPWGLAKGSLAFRPWLTLGCFDIIQFVHLAVDEVAWGFCWRNRLSISIQRWFWQCGCLGQFVDFFLQAFGTLFAGFCVVRHNTSLYWENYSIWKDATNVPHPFPILILAVYAAYGTGVNLAPRRLTMSTCLQRL